MAFSYLVVGAGRQGVASAYDLVKFGQADRVTLADVNTEAARAAAELVNRLTGNTIANAIQLDVRDREAVRRAFLGYSAVISAVPYFNNLDLTRDAIATRVNFCDMGGNTDLVREQHALDREAHDAGVRIVPDCGMGPGMGNTLAVHAMSLLDEAEHVYLYDGGLPRNPHAPWNYALTFNVEGLTNEYYGGITVLRNGKLEHVPCFTELETIQFPGLGELEAFIIAGGVSTAPWTFLGRLKTYQIKVLRYPGTFAQLKAFSDLGLFELDPVVVDGKDVIPRHVFHALFEPQVRVAVPDDVCVVRVHAVGKREGKPATATVDVVDYFDPLTGFTAMQRLTGWHTSIVAIMMARGETPIGSIPQEVAVPADQFVWEARQRGIRITEEVKPVKEAASTELVSHH
jgi:lysine 6-dehydrogenase